ncbi:MAG TPA: hypothetical protein PLR99_06455, partial [Polyangiaceae bacterium]|nr:hypothetical protein [Polyangiaceae bacterium]
MNILRLGVSLVGALGLTACVLQGCNAVVSTAIDDADVPDTGAVPPLDADPPDTSAPREAGPEAGPDAGADADASADADATTDASA